MKIRLVLDTNVLVSGYLWDGKPRQLLKLVRKGGFTILYSKETLGEFARVLSLKFGFSARETHVIITDVSSIGEMITIKSHESPVSDDVTDNTFINLAIDGNAKIIVSGDSHILKLKRFKNIEFIRVADFLKRYS